MTAMTYVLWLLLMGVSSFLAWFCLNSRQWLLAWIWLPASLAAFAAYQEGGLFAIIVYVLTLCAMMFPVSGIFSLINEVILLNKFDHKIMKSWESWDIKEMWHKPIPMRERR